MNQLEMEVTLGIKSEPTCNKFIKSDKSIKDIKDIVHTLHIVSTQERVRDYGWDLLPWHSMN